MKTKLLMLTALLYTSLHAMFGGALIVKPLRSYQEIQEEEEKETPYFLTMAFVLQRAERHKITHFQFAPRVVIDQTKRLIKQRHNLDERDSNGRTRLMHAVVKCWPEVVTLLVENGAGLNHVDRSGKTALDYAIECCTGSVTSAKIIDVLYNRGAKTKEETC